MFFEIKLEFQLQQILCVRNAGVQLIDHGKIKMIPCLWTRNSLIAIATCDRNRRLYCILGLLRSSCFSRRESSSVIYKNERERERVREILKLIATARMKLAFNFFEDGRNGKSSGISLSTSIFSTLISIAPVNISWVQLLHSTISINW